MSSFIFQCFFRYGGFCLSYLCLFKVSLPAFFSKKRICNTQTNKKLEGMSFYPGYLCQFKVSLPTFFSKKQICHLQINKKLKGMCFCLSYLCLLKVSLPTFFSKKVGHDKPEFVFSKKQGCRTKIQQPCLLQIVSFCSCAFLRDITKALLLCGKRRER